MYLWRHQKVFGIKKKKRNQENRIIRSAAEAPGFYALVSMTIGHRSKIGFLCERRQENSKWQPKLFALIELRGFLYEYQETAK